MVTSINHGICGVPTCWNCLKMIHLIVEDFWSSELPRLRESPLATQRMWFTSICSTPSPATSHLQRLQRLCWSRAEILVPSDQCPLHGTGKPKLVLFKRGNCLDLWPLSLHWRTILLIGNYLYMDVNGHFSSSGKSIFSMKSKLLYLISVNSWLYHLVDHFQFHLDNHTTFLVT